MLKSFSEYQLMKSFGEMFTTQKKEKNLILEPLCVILRLSLLQYKEKGTKLSIHNNSIKYQEPSYDQGFIRMMEGDTREDLHNLYHPILKYNEWYSYDSYQFIYDECINGISMLTSNYGSHSTIRHTLNHYIDILRNSDNKYKENIEINIEINPIIDKLKEIWTFSEIQSVVSLLKLVKEDINRDIYLDSLEMILTSKEEFINEYLKKISTEY
jgi:hypothetical protein|tara:strand:+ start:66 stop:704 length:639 start_codon:yes stop_codon:yes gene_type:complete